MPDLMTKNELRYERCVSVRYIKKNMFVSRLDRPWIETPFWVQGFVIRTDQEVEALKKYCNSVYIDITRGDEAKFYIEHDYSLTRSTNKGAFKVRAKHSTPYQNEISYKEELDEAKKALEVATEKFFLVMDNVHHGKSLGLKYVPQVVNPLIDSVIRNPDALLLLIHLRDKNDLINYHSIDACVMTISFARYLGKSQEQIFRLAVGSLLMDLGKLNIPEKVLNKTEPLTEAEVSEVRSHVDDSINFLKDHEDFHSDVINMIRSHHERSNGSGYPQGLTESSIPENAKIAGIIDCYNAMCNERPHNNLYIPSDSIRNLDMMKESHFNPSLVDEFMYCMGQFPNGSLVELRNGKVGVVLSQHHLKYDKPEIMLLLDENKKAYKDFKVIDLSSQKFNNKSHSIERGLHQEAYGINLPVIYDKLNLAIHKEMLN